MAKKYGIVSDEFAELAEKLDKLGSDLKAVTEKCLEVAPEIINPKLHAAMQKHKRTGKTEKSIIEDAKVEWDGTTGKIPVGFAIKDGSKTNLASIFLMYGTARHAPANQYGAYSGSAKGIDADKQLYNAIYGSQTKKEIAQKQTEILKEAVEKAVNGK